MTKKVAILQSNYIPWKGYFDIINSVDEFILFDEVQFTKRDWRNRNQIKTAQGLQWLSIPVKQSDKRFQRICDAEISEPNWGKKHWNSLSINYSKAAFFKMYNGLFADLYLNNKESNLSRINFQFIKAINDILGISTKITWSSDYRTLDGKNERLVSLCLASSAQVYLSGPAAKNYLNESLFQDLGINVTWMDYSGYDEYRQLYPPFQHYVSILDLIFNEGPTAREYMKSFNSELVA